MPEPGIGNPIELEIFKNIFHSIAEDMGAALRRTAFSPNIKERRDYSCAVFDGAGEVVAMGDHMPVHLGSMPMSVRAAIDHIEFAPGDVVMLNDPFLGGTHLPDITIIAPVYAGSPLSASSPARAVSLLNRPLRRPGSSRRPNGGKHPSIRQTDFLPPDFYVAARAHHADVGGAYPGSMGLCREIYQEGVRIPPVHLVKEGVLQRGVMDLLLNNVRTPVEREGDLRAQMAACHSGTVRLQEVSARYGLKKIKSAMKNLHRYSSQMMAAFVRQVPEGAYRAEDFLDDDGVSDSPVRIAVTITFAKPVSSKNKRGKKTLRRSAPAPAVTVDFTGSDPQVQGCINAVEAITYSACFYVFRCLLNDDVPATAGLMRPIRVIAPPGTVVNARPPAAVAGGNVETSQRIVDVLLRALAQAMPALIPAGSSGTMNNLTIGGLFPADGPRGGEPFAYYETIAGGMGARPGKDGVSGVHTHMTNSLNTPAEALEYAYPFRVSQYSFRPQSGGRGKWRGGDGLIREIELLTDAEVTVLADRRKRGPYGLNGGADGAKGKTVVTRRHERSGREPQLLPGKVSLRLCPGDRIRIESSGGGGWGKPERE